MNTATWRQLQSRGACGMLDSKHLHMIYHQQRVHEWSFTCTCLHAVMHTRSDSKHTQSL